MNKDFFNKPISFKDIDLRKINLKKLKNKKEIIIGILILSYVVVVFCVGNSLLKRRNEIDSQYDIKKSTYLSLKNSAGKEKITENILELQTELDELSLSIASITPAEFQKLFDEFKNGSGLSWENVEISLKSNEKDFDVYVVNARFSGTLEKIEKFLEYVDTYPKLVRIDTMGFSKKEITGGLNGQVKMSFYFEKLAE